MILFLDLASNKATMACVDAEKILALAPADHRMSDRELPEAIESVLKKAKKNWKDIDRIATVIGPGGFMSIRVAVAASNALSWAKEIPQAGIHLSDLYAARSETPDFLWVHSTKSTEIFARGFGLHKGLFEKPTHLPIDELMTTFPKKATWAGELLPAHRAIVEEKGGKEAPLKDLADVLPAFLGDLDYKKERLEPWYGRLW